ncbi:MAG TPA: transposase [Candidatus Dormibacteraeota bacterium]|nr:transposase [Candidatus Dormibacteraeota bacterium]
MPRLDWSKRAEYVRSRHGVEPAWADEAVEDDHAVWLTLDPASRSGRSVRVIGYSITAREVLTVILVAADVDVTERPAGDWCGSNAGVASPRDRRLYGKEN